MTPFSLLHLRSDAVSLRAVRRLHPSAAPPVCYRRAARVSACIRQAIGFQAAARDADLAVRPLLCYYELVHAMKALMYLRDLDYPASSSVLQHGLSVRKTKRDLYHWPLESVYVQRDGIVQSFVPWFEPNLALPSRFLVGDLLRLLSSTRPLVSAFWTNMAVNATPSSSQVHTQPDYPQWLVHFVLLFTLASLCRYNPLEWSDILLWHHEVDALLVRTYLESFDTAVGCVNPVFERLWADVHRPDSHAMLHTPVPANLTGPSRVVPQD